MQLDKVKKGMKFKFTGNKEGCAMHKCIDCPTFKGKILIVKEVLEESNRRIHFYAKGRDIDHCTCHHDDMSPLKLDWSEKLV